MSVRHANRCVEGSVMGPRRARGYAVGVLMAAVVPGSATALAAPVTSQTTPAAGSEPAATASVPSLRVWVEGTVPEGERIHEWIEEKARTVLGERERKLGAEDLVHVSVRGGPYDYRVHVALVRRNQLLDEQLEVIVCECGSDEMLEQVGKAIDTGAERLLQAGDAERVEREEVERPLERTPELADQDEPWHPSALGVGGIITAALGATMLGGGIVMMMTEPRPIPDRASLMRDWRPPGIAMVAISSTAVAAGVTMAVVDLVRCRKSPAPSGCKRGRDADERRLGLVPSVMARGGALVLSRRF